MRYKILLLVASVFITTLATELSAQKFFTRDANVNFNATAKGSPENISAKHNSGTIIMDLATGNVQASVLVRGFLFERALMQEHFNENYMESEKYPKAQFKGQITKAEAESLKKDGKYTFNIKGEMDMHGKSNAVSTPFKFTVKNGKITSEGTIDLPLASYGIDIPSVVGDKVAKSATVTISAAMDALKK